MKKNHPFKNSFGIGLLITGLISCVIISCTVNSPDNKELKIPTQEDSKTAIKEKIELANEKWASGDPLGFVECAADDITWIDDLGAQLPVSGKEALQAYLENFKGQIPPHEHELSDMAFQFYDDMVIISYRYNGTFDGEPADPWKVSSVYQYSKDGWYSVHENWSLVMKKQ
jgi:ketosteroid isomerase-like protein